MSYQKHSKEDLDQGLIVKYIRARKINPRTAWQKYGKNIPFKLPDEWLTDEEDASSYLFNLLQQLDSRPSENAAWCAANFDQWIEDELDKF